MKFFWVIVITPILTNYQQLSLYTTTYICVNVFQKTMHTRLIINLPLAIECVAFASQQFEYFMPSLRYNSFSEKSVKLSFP